MTEEPSTNLATEDGPNILDQKAYEDVSYTIIKARIGMLATAIGGPDHSSDSANPPYKIGDDCLACIKDLITWFKLVDDKQKRWDVEMATAEFKILQNDLIPIMLDWETKSSSAARKSKKTGEDISVFFPNKAYYDRIALGCLQLMVLMTWPLIITDQSSYNQVNYYYELKKHQLLYKHAILSTENGKVLKAAIRLALNVMQRDRLDRTSRDDSLIRMVLHFIKNIVAIEPGEVTISSVKRLKKPLTAEEMLPTNIRQDDISINSVIDAFDKNKVFGFLLTISSSLTESVDEEFVNLPLLELMFFMTKDINPERLFKSSSKKYDVNVNHEISESNLSNSGKQLSELLAKEHEKKINVIKNTSSRHSRFGGLLSIRTPQNTRLTVASNSVNMNDDAALQEIDSRKKWNKSIRMRLDVIEGLSSTFLNTEGSTAHITIENLQKLKEFLSNFVDSSFNLLLRKVTDHFTSEIQDQLSLHKIEYMLFISWFIKFQRIRCLFEKDTSPDYVAGVLLDECYIMFMKYMRESYDHKNWPVIHAGMLLFTEYLNFLLSLDDSWQNDIYAVIGKLLGENMLQLLSALPKSASSHSSQYIKSCINMTHVVLKTFDRFNEKSSLAVESKRKRKVNLKHLTIEKFAKEHDIDYEEAFELLEEQFKKVTINFDRVFRGYLSEATLSMYIKYLQSFKEIEVPVLSRILKFLQRVFVEAKEEILLYRIDFLILCKEILGPQGLPLASDIRHQFSRFIEYFLHRFRKKLMKMPSLYVSILFPMIHDSQIAYFMKNGTMKPTTAKYEIVVPSVFVNIEDEDAIPDKVLKDMHIGILVSSLIDDGYEELVDSLLSNLLSILEQLKQQSSDSALTDQPQKITYNVDHNEIKRALHQQADFRRLLIITGFAIPDENNDECYFSRTNDINEIHESIDIIKKYKSLPFESSSGKPASYYLSYAQSSDDHYDNYGSEVENDDYFQELETMERRIAGRELTKGKAKSKSTVKKVGSKKRRRSSHSESLSDDSREIPSIKSTIVSKEYIYDSDDDDPRFSTIFFENEKYLRQLLDKNKGALSSEQYQRFTQFCQERLENDGVVISDFSDLFDNSLNMNVNGMHEGLKEHISPSEEHQNDVETQQIIDSNDLSSDEYNSESENDEDDIPVRKRSRDQLSFDNV